MIVNTKQGEIKNEILFLKFRPGKNLITIEALKNSATILLVNIHLFTIRHSAEVARVKIEKLKRIPILHNSNGTDQRVLQVYQCIIFSVEQLNLLNSQIRHFSKNHEKFSKSGIFDLVFPGRQRTEEKKYKLL